MTKLSGARKLLTAAQKHAIELQKEKLRIHRESILSSTQPSTTLAYSATSAIDIANPIVEKILSFDHAPNKERRKACIQDAINKYKLHDTDTGSAEATIAALTVRINSLSTHMDKHRKDVPVKRRLEQLGHQRVRMLKFLKQQDLARYFELSRKLDITIPSPINYITRTLEYRRTHQEEIKAKRLQMKQERLLKMAQEKEAKVARIKQAEENRVQKELRRKIHQERLAHKKEASKE